MKSIVYLLKELKYEVVKMVFLNTFLDMALLFLGLYLIFILLHFYPIFMALIPALIVFVVILRRRLNRFGLKSVEDKNPDIKEILRTAADNIDEDNFVVHQLHIELIRKMKNVTSSSFIKLGEVSTKIGVTLALSFFVIFLSANNIYIVDLNKIFIDTFIPTQKGKEGFGEDIYGDKTELEQIDKEIEFEFKPLSFEINIDKVGEVESKDFERNYAEEVYVTQEAAFEENIPREQQEIVKNYFERIRGG